MALSSMLDIITFSCDELGIGRPGTAGIIASSVPQDRQLLALLQTCGDELAQRHQWSALVATANITTATASSSYSLPTDFSRVLDDAGWNRSNHFPMLGSISPQRNQFWLSSSVVAPATRKEYRITLGLGSGQTSTVYVQPAPTAAETLSFLYLSKNWIINGSTPVARFVADADTTLLDPLLLVKFLKWRWRLAKGLAAADHYNEFQEYMNLKVAGDIGAPTIDMAGPVGPAPYDWVNIPDGNWSIT